jgi:hypothetical protein
MLVGLALAFASLAASAGPAGAPVTVQNVPLPVTVGNTVPVAVQGQPLNVTVTNASPISMTSIDSVEGFKLAYQFSNPPFRPPQGVPSILTPVLYTNNSSTTAFVNLWLSSMHNGQGIYPCSGSVRATAGEIVITPPSGQLGHGLFVPMIEYKTFVNAGVEYCWTHGGVAPLYLPPGHSVRLNVIYSAESNVPTPFYVTINGYYMN